MFKDNELIEVFNSITPEDVQQVHTAINAVDVFLGDGLESRLTTLVPFHALLQSGVDAEAVLYVIMARLLEKKHA